MVLKESNAQLSGIGALCEGRRVPAVTIFGWDDVLCPTTHAEHERTKRTAAVFGGGGRPAVESKEHRKEVRSPNWITLLLDSKIKRIFLACNVERRNFAC